jgi:Fe-S oxidoreductase/nitrate reductase gamma subunit
MLPNDTSTELLGAPGWVLLWLVAILAFGIFGFRLRHLVRILKRARPEDRFDRKGARLRHVLVNVFGQRRLLDEPFGVPHFFIFWAFVFFVTSFFWNLVRGLVPALPVPYADEIPVISFLMEILGSLAVVGLAVAALRRYVFTPRSLERTADASLLLVLIAAVLLTFLAGQGFRAVAEGHALAGSPIGAWLGRAATRLGLEPEAGAQAFVAVWWLHMVTALGFLAYLPHSKNMHLLASPFGVYFASLQPGAMPAASEGAARPEQFTWRQLYSALACAECERCNRVCPAFQSGYPLSPKTLILHLREHVLSKRGNGHRADASPTLEGAMTTATTSEGPQLLEGRVAPDEVWACTTCLACMRRCPVFNEHLPLVVEMRRHLVSEGALEDEMQDALMHLTRYGNSFGMSPRGRARWTRDLDFKIKDARKEPVEYLWFVGDYASFDPRVQPITRAVARILHDARLDFGILHEAELNSGADARRLGEEGLFEMLQEKNLKALEDAQFNNIVTTDPHTYQALKNEYAGLVGNRGVRVLHYTELLDELLRLGRLSIREPLQARATYHDPCYLGRYNGIYEPPRRVLTRIGLRLLEMPRNRDNALCCGAGGGRIWMEDTAGVQERPVQSRLREAAALPNVGILALSCPKDFVTFQDALKTTDLEGVLDVRDVAELVQDAIGLSERSGSHAEAQA